MANSFCRALDCGSNFSTNRQREQHEQLMHKQLVKDAAYLLLDKIVASNSFEALQKKVLRTSAQSFSYAEAKVYIRDDTVEGKAILNTMQKIVETYFAYNPDHGVKEMLKNSEFTIK